MRAFRFLAFTLLFATVFALLFASSPTFAAALDAAAAKNVADNDQACRRIQPFYGEIGTKDAVLAGGAAGDGSVTRDTVFNIASASKWVFGAYAVQRENGKIDQNEAQYLRMSAGYDSMRALGCLRQRTVVDCLNAEDNARYTPEDYGHFYYSGSQFQKWAVDHGMGALDRYSLADEYKRVLGSDIPFAFGPVQLAGGLNMSAASYALFLQKILRGQLLISRFLGADAICTHPGDGCDAVRSPIPRAWHYSFGHWVEDDKDGDGSFSSAGAFGFYPWIDAGKNYYGIVSRHARAGRSEERQGAGYTSAVCGQKIRQAFWGNR